MKKILFMLAIVLATIGINAQTTIDRAMSVWARNIANANFTEAYTNIAINVTDIATNLGSINTLSDSVVTALLKADSANINEAVIDTLEVDSIIVENITFENGATVNNSETDTLFITEVVVKIEGNLTVTGHVSEPEHSSGQTTVTTPGTQPIATGGTFERMNGGAIAYTGDHLHDFTESDGRLTYIGTEAFDATVHWNISLESGETAQVVQLRIALNGTTIALSNQGVTFTNQNSNASFGSTRLIDMVQNDYVELYITSDTSSDDVIINNATLNITKH